MSSSSEEPSNTSNNVNRGPGRPKKRKRGRPKLLSSTREEQRREAQERYRKRNPQVNREAVRRYSERNPEVNREAVRRYSEQHPEVNREAVQRYSERNPEVNREAVRRYSEQHPEVNRQAVQRYSERNPEVNREAVRRYSERNPEVNREAVRRYSEQHPEVNRGAVQRYSELNPEVNREAVRRYSEQHPEVNREAVQRYSERNPEVNREAVRRYSEQHPEVNREAVRRYNELNPDIHREATIQYDARHPEARRARIQIFRIANANLTELRHIPTFLGRKIIERGPMGFWRGNDLMDINLFKLKKTSLWVDDIYKCEYCEARLFEEEKCRKMWCCGQGSYNILQLPQLDAQYYNSRDFLNRARAYNDLFAFCALQVTGGYRHPSGLSFFKIEGRMYHQIYNLNAQGERFVPKGGQEQFVNRCRLYIDDGEERKRLAEGRALKLDIIEDISSYMNNKNPYIKDFRMLSREPSVHAHIEYEITHRKTHGPKLGDKHIGTEVHAVLNPSSGKR